MRGGVDEVVSEIDGGGNEMSIDNKSDDLFWWIVLFSLFENEQQKRDQLRNKETELLKLAQQKYTEYFDELFQHGIPTYYLLTVFGGMFASTLVVLFCEINKYLIDKKNTENQLFFQTVYLYQSLFLMQHNILDYQSHPSAQIPPNLLDNTTHMVKSQAIFIQGIDYTTFKKNNEIVNRHNSFKKDTFAKLMKLENGINFLKSAILEERIANRESRKTNPDYITSSTPKVADVLAEQINIIMPLLKEINLYLKTIDDNCKNVYNWNTLHNNIQNSYVTLSSLNNK